MICSESVCTPPVGSDTCTNGLPADCKAITCAAVSRKCTRFGLPGNAGIFVRCVLAGGLSGDGNIVMVLKPDGANVAVVGHGKTDSSCPIFCSNDICCRRHQRHKRRRHAVNTARCHGRHRTFWIGYPGQPACKNPRVHRGCLPPGTVKVLLAPGLSTIDSGKL